MVREKAGLPESLRVQIIIVFVSLLLWGSDHVQWTVIPCIQLTLALKTWLAYYWLALCTAFKQQNIIDNQK